MSPSFCRDCDADAADTARRCASCGSPRLVTHPEAARLALAHIDCDAFYAAVEKRDDPSLRDRPVIVGGGKRGVVATCCYVARTYGVRSAMPMFKALDACPDAVVIKPDMEKYARVGRQVREAMLALTPLVEPISIDEAFLDLSGTELLHGAPPARVLARFARDIETRIGITVSVGLSYCKFLAKVASDLDKPRGFAVIGRDEAVAFLAPRPVSIVPGIGPASLARLNGAGIRTLGDVARLPLDVLVARLGKDALRLHAFAKGHDERRVTPEREAISVSAETTFDTDIGRLEELEPILWRLCEKVSRRLKAKGVAGSSVTLKLKTADFKLRTRNRSGLPPTQLARRLYEAGHDLLKAECGRDAFRLIGIGAADLAPADLADRPDLAAPDRARDASREAAMDRLRARFGDKAVIQGIALRDRRR
jgi:DNA polymerase-4